MISWFWAETRDGQGALFCTDGKVWSREYAPPGLTEDMWQNPEFAATALRMMSQVCLDALDKLDDSP